MFDITHGGPYVRITTSNHDFVKTTFCSFPKINVAQHALHRKIYYKLWRGMISSINKLTCLTPITYNRGLAPNIRTEACRRPRIEPKSSAVDAEAMCLFFFTTISLLLLLLGTEDGKWGSCSLFITARIIVK